MKNNIRLGFHLLCVLLLISIFSACGGCDEVGGTEHGDMDIGYGDDADASAGLDDVGGTDAGEDAGHDAGPIEDPCDQEGATRQCGTDVGECEFGEQVCTDGVWGPCEGGVEPRPEQCSGLDESCTGVADDAPDSELCQMASECHGPGQCIESQCEYELIVDCTHLDGPCTAGACETKSGACYVVNAVDETACDDGNYCTVDGICYDGICDSLPRDCTGFGDACNAGVCDPGLESCIAAPFSDGTACNDGLFCTVNTSCQDGLCLGSDNDCSPMGDQCNDVVCDEVNGLCELVAVADGTSCSNGLFCTVNDTCQAGVCTAGDDRTCGALGGTCSEGVCDEATQSCTGDALPDGTTCDDGDYCTVNTSCTDGVCGDSAPRDCSHLDDECNIGVCSTSNARCETQPRPDGTSCDDGNFCTVSNTCSAGQCTGQPRDCSSASDQCNTGICSQSAAACVPQPTNIGGSCDDGSFCTVNEVCTSQGVCAGQPRDCSFLDDVCQYGTCDEGAESCVVANEPDGTACPDGQYCTVNESCIAGTCVVEPRDCSYLDDSCTDGVCSESNQTCQPVNTCDPCATGEPTASAGPDLEVVPNTPVTLDGTDSSDPGGQSLTYAWTVVARPSGSSADLNDPTSATPTILADVAGEFTICLVVENQDNCTSQESCMTLTVKPQASLHIELTWDTNDPVDLDLHYRAPNAPWFDRTTWPPGASQCGPDHQAAAVWFCVPSPDWGAGPDGSDPDGIAENDPYLDVDDLTGDGPENINQDVLFDGNGFQVGVHHWFDNGNGPQEGRVRIYINGDLEFEEFHTISCGEFWEVAELDISDNGTTVTITSLNQSTFQETEQGPCQ